MARESALALVCKIMVSLNVKIKQVEILLFLHFKGTFQGQKSRQQAGDSSVVIECNSICLKGMEAVKSREVANEDEPNLSAAQLRV